MALSCFLLFLCFSIPAPVVSAVNSDGKALLSLLRHWRGVPSSVQLSWNDSDAHPCSWVGVRCNQWNQFIVALNLSGYGISGQLRPEIANLTYLKSVDLSLNSYSGSIPSEIGNCSLLEYLDLSGNSFTGGIPESLRNLKNFRYMNLGSNSLNGTLSESLFWISSLNIIYLNNNELTGPISSNVVNCSALQELHLNANSLTGKIPAALANCQSLVDLRMEQNKLEGEIPNELGMLSQLKNLFLHRNHLSGKVPISIWKIPSLENFLVHQNNLTGEVPLQVSELEHLKNLSLYDNKFTGVIPLVLGIKSSLVQVDFSNNQFTGQIPPHLCFRNHLRILNLGRNNFQGAIPPEVGSCSNLTTLILQQNELTGAMPDFVGNTNLLFMDLSNNCIDGGITSSLANLTNIISVDLSMNKLSGPIPPEIGRLVNLQALNLSQNRLNGELPSQLSNCRRFLHLDIGHNLLNGSIPPSLRSLAELSTLTLSDNCLTGNIPTFLFGFRKLSKLQVGGNMLAGNIPSTIGSLGAAQNLMLLNLSSNRLTGEVPIQLRGLTMLERIDISRNNLSGSLRFLHDIQSLVFINVSYNNFSGPIPSTLLKFLNSSPTSFAGNSGLIVNCLPLSCTGDRKLKTHTYRRSKEKGHRRTKIAMIAVGSSLPFAFLVVVFTKILRQGIRFKQQNGSYIPTYLLDSPLVSDVLCRHQDILDATDNLNDLHIIGKGGQGTVYKVTLSSGAVFVAKKYQFTGIRNGRRSMTRELETIGKIRHRNLIQFMGSWTGNNYGLILYPYMENGSLHDALHERKPQLILDWNIRYKIALSTAHGLSYLHFDCTPPILHRDIKSKNILLGYECEPQISDFGLAVLQEINAASASAPVIIGTAGYIAPENAFRAKTKESDVYSYGVILLELITRKKAVDPSFEGQPDIVSWVQSLCAKRIDLECIVDPDLLSELSHPSVKDQVHSVLVLARRCTQQDWNKRPSMRDVVNQLMDIQRLRWTHYSRPEVGSSSNS